MGLIHDEVALMGHSVEYFCADEIPDALNGRAARFTFPLLILRRAAEAARSGQPYDVINVHEPSGAAIATWKSAAKGSRVVVTSHGVEQRAWERVLEDVRVGRERLKSWSRIFHPTTVLWQTRLALRHADHVFCLNMEDHAYLMSRFRLPADRITRIYPGADPIYGRAARDRNYSRTETLLFAGTWLKRKGTDDVIPAFRRLAASYPQIKLVILNGGVSETAVRDCFPAELGDRISCLRTEPEEGNASGLAAGDIFLLPSLFEGTPLTLIEAMWSGMPIVTTATCGMKDVIEDGRNGLLVPIRSPEAIVRAVERLLADEALRAKLGRAAHAEARLKYTWQRSAGPVRTVYERLCRGEVPDDTASLQRMQDPCSPAIRTDLPREHRFG